MAQQKAQPSDETKAGQRLSLMLPETDTCLFPSCLSSAKLCHSNS